MSLPAAIRLRTGGKHETKTYLVKIVDQLQRAVLIKQLGNSRKTQKSVLHDRWNFERPNAIFFDWVYSGYDWQLPIKFKTDLSF